MKVIKFFAMTVVLGAISLVFSSCTSNQSNYRSSGYNSYPGGSSQGYGSSYGGGYGASAAACNT